MWDFNICKNDCGGYLENFFNSMNEGFALHEIICDGSGKPVDYRFIEVNETFLSITGLKKDNLLNKKISEVYPNIEPMWVENYGRVALEGVRIQFESYFSSLDKHFKVSAFSPSKGQFITFFYDITELKKAAQIQEQHRILFENAHDIILYTKLDGSIINANNSALSKYGYTYEEFTSLRVQDIRHPSTMQTFLDEMNASDTVGITFECTHMKKDGTSFQVEVSVKSVIVGSEGTRMHIIRDITERKMAEERMAYLANYDALTGIPNRGHLIRHLDMMIEHSNRGNFKFAVMLFDIDKFKRINDTYGHNAGDIVLKDTAKRVSNALRKSDLVARLGGDEFVLIQSFVGSSEDSRTMAAKVLDQFKTPVKLDSTNLSISLSIGISIFPDDASDKDSLLNLADKAMYLSKQSGGERFTLYSNIKEAI